MKQLVVIPGGFHPFHAGHAALYQAAVEAFPEAEVYIAAGDNTSRRPFPFRVKQKLAQLDGVDPQHFVQVSRPFQPREITNGYDLDNTALIFVRSTKEKGLAPVPGQARKDGTAGYLQPLQDK